MRLAAVVGEVLELEYQTPAGGRNTHVGSLTPMEEDGVWMGTDLFGRPARLRCLSDAEAYIAFPFLLATVKPVVPVRKTVQPELPFRHCVRLQRAVIRIWLTLVRSINLAMVGLALVTVCLSTGWTRSVVVWGGLIVVCLGGMSMVLYVDAEQRERRTWTWTRVESWLWVWLGTAGMVAAALTRI